ncbi:PfkB family carbohydrate kinase [Komagataeibacter rhaeticus]|nr:PfkB family carbohydrate kinase [Komagataeibacter rhaeticus]
MAVARLGQAVALAGWTGRDMLASMARTTLEGAGVDTRWLLEDAATGTGRAFITINRAGENQILVDGGANMAHTDTSLPCCCPRWMVPAWSCCRWRWTPRS